MSLRTHHKVPQWNRNCLLYALIILTSSLFGQVCTSDNNINYNGENYGSNQRRVPSSGSGAEGLEKRSSYAVISQAFSDTVNNEFGIRKMTIPCPRSGAPPKKCATSESCSIDDLECTGYSDQIGLEAIRSLHKQLDDDDNGDIDLSESDDFLREELKYEGGYEKRHRAFHFNDDMHISVKELWEAWLKSEVHNWTLDQTCEWLIQSVQLPQYVNLFKKHKINGRILPRLAVNNLHFVSNVLGVKDPIHKQKIALKAMDAVLFGPPRETGTRWKDIVLVTLLLTAIIGSWYAYQQNKNAKGHLKRMARDMEQLHKAEKELSKMQTELERARLEQENVGKEKMDLERRLKEAPAMKSSSSDAELQQLKQEIEMLRSELSRAEVELIDHHWTPPPGLQHWLQLTYELETRSHQKKRVVAESQLLSAREACEKLRKKRSSFVGAFVSTHGKSIDDVDRTIVEARNSLSEVTNELQERLHRWKQVEQALGCNIVNNNGIAYLENMLYRSNGASSKTSRGRITSSQDDLDDDSIQGYLTDVNKYLREREDSSASEDDRDRDTVTFVVGGGYEDFSNCSTQSTTSTQITSLTPTPQNSLVPMTSAVSTINSLRSSLSYPPQLVHQGNSVESTSNSNSNEETRSNISTSSERLPPAPPRAKKQISLPPFPAQTQNRAPMPPPRRIGSGQNIILTSSQSTGAFMESLGALANISPSTPFTDVSAKLPPTFNSQYKQCEDNISTDSSSFDEETKKRKRKLFSFGKKSNKSKVIKNP